MPRWAMHRTTSSAVNGPSVSNTHKSVNMLGFGSIKPGDQPGVSRNEFNARMSWMQTELKNFAQEGDISQGSARPSRSTGSARRGRT